MSSNDIDFLQKYYKIKQKIGKGAYGDIYKAINIKNKKICAIKIVKLVQTPEVMNKILKQLQIMTQCQHQYIIKCYGVKVVSQHVIFELQYCLEGSLTDVMRKRNQPYSQSEIKIIMKSVLQALKYLHAKKIVHRDIKGANLLLNAHGVVKLADFGVSTVLQPQFSKNTIIGSPFWMSPQLLSNTQYTLKTDIWSLGITAIQLAEGQPPYSNLHPYRAIFHIQSNPPKSLSSPENWSKQFNSFVNKCLILQQNKRPTPEDLLNHEFILGQKIFDMENQMTNKKQFMKKNNKNNKNQDFNTVLIYNVPHCSIWENQQRQVKTFRDKRDTSIKNLQKSSKKKKKNKQNVKLYTDMYMEDINTNNHASNIKSKKCKETQSKNLTARKNIVDKYGKFQRCSQFKVTKKEKSFFMGKLLEVNQQF